MGATWAHLTASIVASFLASLVECVEALTVVLAVGSVRGWRSAVGGSVAALAVLLVIVLSAGSALMRIPLHIVQFTVGILLVMFGLRWLRKAILRSARLIPLRDEEATFSKYATALRLLTDTPAAWDKMAFATSFNITMLEGTEVVFIVVAVGASGSGMLLPSGLGAAAALLVVISLGWVLHRPLAKVPENTLKFIVGVLLSAFGTFWVGEGMDLAWPGSDWSIPGLVAAYLSIALVTIPCCRRLSSTTAGL